LRLVDCYAERVVGLLASNNNAAGRRYMADVRVQGEVRYAYYGVGASFIREGVEVELVCHNVRRALIADALRDARIALHVSSSSDWPGSNGLVALVSCGASSGNVERVRVRVDASGECIYRSYVHFYHQGREKAGLMRDIDATVNVRHVDSVDNLFVFDHETERVQARTARTWDRIALHGSVSGRFGGKVVANPSVQCAPGAVLIDPGLAALQRIDRLGAGFRVRSPGSP
jgi:hypothetical protein